MSYGDNKLYLYENIIELVVTTNYIYVDNKPMNTRKIKIHKGVTNEIVFTVRDRDRKLQNVFSDTLRAVMVDPSTKKRALTKEITDTLDIGKVLLTINEADTMSLEAGLYEVYVTRSTSEDADYPLYTDQDNNMKFDVELTNQAFVSPVQTQVSDEFLQTGNTILNDPANTFVSSALYGNLDRNYTNAQHTLAVYLDNFAGNIRIQASCLNSVPSSDDTSTEWFDVEEHSITASETILSSSFVANCNWVRIVSEPQSGTVTKVLLRN